MSVSSSTRLPVGNKDFTNATVVIIGAGISGMLVGHELRGCFKLNRLASRHEHGDRPYQEEQLSQLCHPREE